MRIFRRKEERPEVEPIQKASPSEVPKRTLWEMAVAPIKSRVQLVVEKYSKLKVQVKDIGTRLTAFDDELEALEKRREAVRHLIALKGEGAEEIRTELASVLWCHPDDVVREEVVTLVDSLEDEETRVRLLELMESDSNPAVKKEAYLRLHPEEIRKEVA